MSHFPHTLIHSDAAQIAGWTREAPTSVDCPQARIVLVGPEQAVGGATEVIPT
ncbi:MAG: hypothetical protein HGA19_20485, partial [Oscillochloris sp.]|nr:hypothetical protein [Oscillochloris sp.]